MIEIEGRVLAGLDEFMLRAGHLALVCRVASDVGGSWIRIHRETAERLSSPVRVKPDENQKVAEYLSSKGLCRSAEKAQQSDRPDVEYAYAELETYRGPDDELLVRRITDGEAVTVSWQDRNLSMDGVPSRVGALTWSAKPGSKTGLSHICDWAQFLDLIDSTGQVLPIGRLLIAVSNINGLPFEEWNPYLVGPERLVLAHQYLRKDIDLLARFAPLLQDAPAPLTKATCRALFVNALQSCIHDADRSTTLPSGSRFELFQQMRDLERAARKAQTEIDKTSTAWHRASSRVELLVDIGLLEKGRKDPSEKFKYLYYPTKGLERAVRTLACAKTGEEWIEDNLVEITLNRVKHDVSDEPISTRALFEGLSKVVAWLRLPTTQFPIDCLVLGLACLNSIHESQFQSLRDIRSRLEALPATYPNVARLARGREGTRAEFISINVKSLAESKE